MIWIKEDYLLSDDQERIDVDWTISALSDTYWGKDRSVETLRTGIENSLCFGLYHRDQQVGFARGVTDQATFSWIADVIIAEAHRGRGLGKWMVEQVINDVRMQTCSQVLGTRDAQTLYERFGFERCEYLRRKP